MEFGDRGVTILVLYSKWSELLGEILPVGGESEASGGFQSGGGFESVRNAGILLIGDPLQRRDAFEEESE